MTQIRTSALGLLLGLAAFFALSAPAHAQEDVQSLFDQGMSAYRTGDHDAALSAFRQVVAAMPDDLAAVELLHSSQDGLLELLVAGGEFETFAREVLASAAAMNSAAIRDASAAASDAEACFADSYEDRARAIFALGQKYGPFAVPPLVARFADSNEDVRLNAIYALSRLGSEAVLPLLSATHSSNKEVRIGALMALAQMGDARVAARVVEMANADEDGAVRNIAAQMGYAGDAASLHYKQGWNYLMADKEMGLSPAENYGVMWVIDGSRLQAYEVPTATTSLELAKYHFLSSADLGNAKALSALGMVYGSEAALLQGLVDQGQDFQGNLDAQRDAALTLPGYDRNAALHGAIEFGLQAAAVELAQMCAEPGVGPDSGLFAALDSSWPSVQVAAALALSARGNHSPLVVEALTRAMSYQAIRVVHILDGNVARANELASALEAQGVTAVVSTSGADGLVAMHRSVKVDAFVVADPLTDIYAHRVVSEIRRDLRHSEVPVLVLGNEDSEAIDGADMLEAADAATVMASFQDLDGARAGFEATSAAAAAALAHISEDPSAVGNSLESFVAALDRSDAIAVSAATALGFAGASAHAEVPLNNVLADTSRSSAVRSACAYALARLAAQGVGMVDDALFSARLEGDADLTRACSIALGALGKGHISAKVITE